MSDTHWIDTLVARLPHVTSRTGFIEDVKDMSREELQRRLLIASDWMGSFMSCLDGIPEIIRISGSGFDGGRTGENVRAIVSQLLQESPPTGATTTEGESTPDMPTSVPAASN